MGGELYFKSSSARVYDENGKPYNIEELGVLCDRYWQKWEKEVNKLKRSQIEKDT